MQDLPATGPAGWGISGWLGLLAYGVIFVLLVIGAARLARSGGDPDRDDAPPR